MGRRRVILGSPGPFKSRQVRRKGKGKGKGKGEFKGTRRAFLGEEPAQDPEWWSEEDCAWWSKGKRGKKGFSKGNEGFWKSRFSHLPTRKGASNDFNPRKGRGKDQKGKGEEGADLQSSLPDSETSSEEKNGHSWESDDRYSRFTDDSLLFSCWMVLFESLYCMDGDNSMEPCQPSYTRCSRSWLHTVNWIKSGSQEVPEKCVVLWHHDRILPMQQVLCVCQL